MTRIRLIACLIFLLAMPVGVADDGMSRGQADAILKELQEIRRVLEKMQQPVAARPRYEESRTAKIPTSGRPALGRPGAPVTLVEFVDYQCPYCQRFFKNTYPHLKQKYVDTGKLRIVVKDLPLGFHEYARKAAVAAHCAGDQGRYWAMQDKLFSNFSRLAEQQLIEYAQVLDLEDGRFRECLSSGKHDAAITKDISDAEIARITGTPSFVVGTTSADVIEGARIRGAQPLAVFERHVDRLLESSR